jgi:uncharacterized membrane protein
MMADAREKSSEPRLDPISQNIGTILAFYTHEEQKISPPQRVLDDIGGIVGRPLYAGSILLFVALWICANVFARECGWVEFDPAPFFWLQGIVSLGALLMTTVVLVKQNRLAKIEELPAHLDLQVNLLTEQKTTKLIELMEELRRDLPMVKDRHDPQAAVFQQQTDPQQVLAAIDEMRETEKQ